MGRITLLGIQVDPLTISELNDCIAEAVARDVRWIIAHHNLHSIYLFHRDAKMKAFYAKAHVMHIDGMPIVFLGRLLGYDLYREQRVTYVDWVRPLMSAAREHRWRVYYLGGKPGVAERAAHVLRNEFPGLEIKTHHGYFDMEGDENEAVLDDIQAYQPHVLMVGMGMPRQEHWVVQNLERIKAHAILTSGACFDYVAGAVPTPPRWMGYVGLEWLFRLMSEPRRLAYRYLIEPWYVFGLFVREWLGMQWQRGDGRR
ncbi:MAG: glycosyltransferase [Bacteroidetes bacterium]|nr:MAG: glycosyltransferase [Bacteroidota bacterium]